MPAFFLKPDDKAGLAGLRQIEMLNPKPRCPALVAVATTKSFLDAPDGGCIGLTSMLGASVQLIAGARPAGVKRYLVVRSGRPVCRNVCAHRRLSWQHHLRVASLTPAQQRKWLACGCGWVARRRAGGGGLGDRGRGLAQSVPCPLRRLAAGPFHNRVPRNRHFVTSVTGTCDALHTEIASARPVSDRSKNLTGGNGHDPLYYTRLSGSFGCFVLRNRACLGTIQYIQ